MGEQRTANDFLRARVRQLEKALEDAARSLDTASTWKYRSDVDVDDLWPWLRSRALVAREAMVKSPVNEGGDP